MSKDFTFITSINNRITITIYGYENLGIYPTIICVHGFKGFKDWGFWPFLGNYFAQRKYAVVTFNFSHNGIENDMMEISNLEKFAENTLSLEIAELKELINAFSSDDFGRRSKKIILIGHSRGGADALLAASNNQNVSAVITLSSIAKLDRYTDRQKAEWRKIRTWEVVNSRTGQVLKLNIDLLEDIELNKNTSLNIENAVRSLNKPFLIIHSTEDLTVPLEEAELLFNWSDKKITTFTKIERSGHTYDIQHPFTTSNSKFDKVLSEIRKFLIKLI